MDSTATNAPDVRQDAAVLYRYEMCHNLSVNVPLCTNSTEFGDYNNTDEEILQVPNILYTR